MNRSGKGNCFVFDKRVSVGHSLQLGDHLMCYGCGWPVDPQMNSDDTSFMCRGSNALTVPDRITDEQRNTISPSDSDKSTRKRPGKQV